MKESPPLTVGEALRRHYVAHGMPADGGRSASRWTMLRIGALSMRLPNFRWRRQALPCHDLHHVLTGYPCTQTGEFQMAAWEFAAGRFPNTFSTLFCLPLVGTGALLTPKQSFAAFARGRRSRTLYADGISAELLASDLQVARKRMLADAPCPTCTDYFAYAALVVLSLALIAVPLVAFAALLTISG